VTRSNAPTLPATRADGATAVDAPGPALERDLADAVAAESPPADLCLRLARAYRQLGDADATLRWALAATDAGDDFMAWRAAAALVEHAAPRATVPCARSARIAVLGSYTTAQFVGLLRLAARRVGIALEVYEGAYGQYRQEVIDPTSALHAFAPDLVLFCVHHGELALPEHAAAPGAEIDAELQRWTSLWQAALAGARGGVIQHNFALPPESALGHLAATLPGSRPMMAHALNTALGAAAGAVAGGAVSIVDCERLSALHGKQRWFDPRYWHLAKQGVALEALPLLARHTAAVIAARLGLSRKCLVLDLDNTLWGGVIGEDGLAGIRLGGGADGEAFVAFQEYVLELSGRACCSPSRRRTTRPTRASRSSVTPRCASGSTTSPPSSRTGSTRPMASARWPGS
jgi:hypothetical protein